jgi:ferritin-like metal-binding protein YciE
MNRGNFHELLYQALETEMGGQAVYRAAIENTATAELKEEWQKYLEETENHERVLRGVFDKLGLDPNADSPGRRILKHKASCLVSAMEMAREGDPTAAELVAAECIVEAETKDHQNWQLLSRTAEHLDAKAGRAVREAVDEVEDEEDEHLYHTMGWARELWIKALGMPAVMPPPEEQKDVRTQIGAARAANAREKMLPRKR